MITVLVRGGLGNQMFEYAVGLAAARRNNTRLLLDTTILRDRFPLKERTFRDYSLDIFMLEPELTPLSKAANAVPIPGLWVAIDLVFIAARKIFGIQKLLKEKKDHVFDPEVMTAPKNTYFWGFWQVPKYFEGYEDEIKNAFTFKHSLTGEAAALGEKIRATNSVALHVRRSDYLLAKYKGMYGETNTGYYEKAIAQVSARVKNATFFVFSDDIAWCKEKLTLPAGSTFVERSSEGPKAAFHMELMSLCKHNIIANSTYSWWGAWLNRNPGKIVFAPKEWNLGVEGGGEIIPAEWVKI